LLGFPSFSITFIAYIFEVIQGSGELYYSAVWTNVANEFILSYPDFKGDYY